MHQQRHDEEGHIQNLSGSKAISKLKALAEDASACMFTTFTEVRPLPTRPMALQKVDRDGSLYFFSAASSNKNRQLAIDPQLQLFFSNTSNSEYLSVFGTATVSTDRAKIEELWNPIAKAWFQGGKDDPDLTVIRVRPDECQYWDTKHGKTVALLKIAASVVTGKTMDDGVEGRLAV